MCAVGMKGVMICGERTAAWRWIDDELVGG